MLSISTQDVRPQKQHKMNAAAEHQNSVIGNAGTIRPNACVKWPLPRLKCQDKRKISRRST